MGNFYESEKINDYEKDVSMTIDLNKTCFFKGEEIKGNIILSSKNGINKTQLINPYINITIQEKGQYSYNPGYYAFNSNSYLNNLEIEKENKNILFIKLDFPNFNGANLLIGVNIPFQIKIPEEVYPSCYFGSDTYIKHLLICDFPSIEAKKTCIIVIKNSIFFSLQNHLLKAPAIYNKEITKHKYALLNSGSFIFQITLTKNIFSYNENIPLIIDIDCKTLSINIKGIVIHLYRNMKKNIKENYLKSREENLVEIFEKKLSLKKGESKYHVEDTFKFPNNPKEINPSQIYLLLDNNKKNEIKKFRLYPSCYGGLLSCEYFIKIKFEMDTLFSTDVSISIPIDFYESLNNIDNDKNKEISLSNNIYNSQQIYSSNNIQQNYNKNEEQEVYYNINNIDENDDNIEDVVDLPTEEDILSYKNNINENKKEEDINNNIESNSPSDFSIFKNNI